MAIAVLEDCGDLRDMMRLLVETRFGLTCHAFSTMSEFLSDQKKILSCDVIFLDVNLGAGQPSGIDAYEWLKDSSYKGRIFFFTGHGLAHPVVLKSKKEGVGVLSKPVDISVLDGILAPLSALRGAES